MKRLGVNRGSYGGEQIDIEANLRAIEAAAGRFGWEYQELKAGADLVLPVMSRRPASVNQVIYLSTGIHGDEPAGPQAMLRLLEENLWPDDAQLFVCPCLNPFGHRLHTRENGDGVDLNRDYQEVKSPEVRSHVEWMQTLPSFDMSLCLHEDWESEGFYLYELNLEGKKSKAESIIQAVRDVCPIDHADEIEGLPASGGIIRPPIDPVRLKGWPEAYYLVKHKTSLSYTLEAPSDFPLAVRVEALVRGVRAALA